MRVSCVVLPLLALGHLAIAQAPPPAGNIVVNGDFSKFTQVENLWDGIDSDNSIAGYRRSASALTESGGIGDVAMPVSVHFADLNGDNLPDLTVADPSGFMWVFFNSGSKTEPKLTHGELVPLMLSRPGKGDVFDKDRASGIPKITLGDFSRRGVLDLLIGNFAGQLLLIRNAGTAAAPSFPQPPATNRVIVPTTSSGALWGNLFAPCAVDWDRDGKMDVLVGEGSYSANAVHLLLNQSSASEPKFTESARYYLAYGDGREHLVPTVADMNGDSHLDLLVGDRGGTVALHLHPGSTWKPGMELAMTSLLSFGNSSKLGGAVAPHAADFNGDGLIDLLIGKNNGRVALALNKGTKEQPKFDPAVDLKGVNLLAKNQANPSNWSTDSGAHRGNMFSYVSVVTDDPAGKFVRAGYFPSPNRVLKVAPLQVAGKDTGAFFEWHRNGWIAVDAGDAGEERPTNSFNIRQQLPKLKLGQSYTLTARVRGRGVQGGAATVAWFAGKELAPSKIERGERGSATVTSNAVKEENNASVNFGSGSSWQTVTKTFTVSFKESELRSLESTQLALVEFKFSLTPYEGECDVADVQLVAK